LPSLHIALL